MSVDVRSVPAAPADVVPHPVLRDAAQRVVQQLDALVGDAAVLLHRDGSTPMSQLLRQARVVDLEDEARRSTIAWYSTRIASACASQELLVGPVVAVLPVAVGVSAVMKASSYVAPCSAALKLSMSACSSAVRRVADRAAQTWRKRGKVRPAPARRRRSPRSRCGRGGRPSRRWAGPGPSTRSRRPAPGCS